MTSPRRLPPTYPVTNVTAADPSRTVAPPNAEIVWVPVGTHAHPVAVHRHGRVQIYPNTRAGRRGDRGDVLDVVTQLSRWLVLDDVLGLLPIMGHDFHIAYAIAQDWARALRVKDVDPGNWDTVANWARIFNGRSQWQTTLIHDWLDARNITPPDPGISQ